MVPDSDLIRIWASFFDNKFDESACGVELGALTGIGACVQNGDAVCVGGRFLSVTTRFAREENSTSCSIILNVARLLEIWLNYLESGAIN